MCLWIKLMNWSSPEHESEASKSEKIEVRSCHMTFDVGVGRVQDTHTLYFQRQPLQSSLTIFIYTLRQRAS